MLPSGRDVEDGTGDTTRVLERGAGGASRKLGWYASRKQLARRAERGGAVRAMFGQRS
jgi:hypothetical protein